MVYKTNRVSRVYLRLVGKYFGGSSMGDPRPERCLQAEDRCSFFSIAWRESVLRKLCNCWFLQGKRRHNKYLLFKKNILLRRFKLKKKSNDLRCTLQVPGREWPWIICTHTQHTAHTHTNIPCWALFVGIAIKILYTKNRSARWRTLQFIDPMICCCVDFPRYFCCCTPENLHTFSRSNENSQMQFFGFGSKDFKLLKLVVPHISMFRRFAVVFNVVWCFFVCWKNIRSPVADPWILVESLLHTATCDCKRNALCLFELLERSVSKVKSVSCCNLCLASRMQCKAMRAALRSTASGCVSALA